MLIFTGILLIFIPKKLSDFLDVTHEEHGSTDSKDSGKADEKIMLSVYPALNHDR
jgi:hypothetical protein